MVFTPERISERTWKVVENDKFGQYPFLYVILGVDKCILIDTGCGTADYRSFVTSNINKNNLPYLVVCTHVHFDHIGGNHMFCNKCLGICMGSNNQAFTNNYEIHSLALAHHGATVGKFDVTNWLKEGDLIYLDDNNKVKEQSLEIIYTPGHTPDSIALYAHFEKRLFVGDSIYPYTAIHLDSLGSNVTDYIASLKKLISFIADHKNAKLPESTTSTPTKETTTEPVSTPVDPHKEMESQFCEMLGIDSKSAGFNVAGLLQICDWSLENAMNFYLSSPSDVQSMCPPIAAEVSSPKPSQTQPSFTQKSDEIVLSCGHVEANFPSSSLEQMLNLLTFIGMGAVTPAFTEGEYAEYSNDNLTVILSKKDVAKLKDS